MKIVEEEDLCPCNNQETACVLLSSLLAYGNVPLLWY